MSRKYKFNNKEGLYFVSFAAVYWIDVFVRRLYFEIVTDSLNYCSTNLGLRIYSWCIMPSHVHLIFKANEGSPEILLGRVKEHTSKQLVKSIEINIQGSRKEWMLWLFERAGLKCSNVKKRQFWQHHNKPIELWSPEVIDQKAEYIHNNPVEAGFVTEAHYWQYSSAIDYSGGRGLVKIEYL